MTSAFCATSYNALTRSVEFEAAAAFRELGIRSYHYNPLGGGMLTGKFKDFDQVSDFALRPTIGAAELPRTG